MAQIILPKYFDASLITCETVCKNKAGGNIVYLKYPDTKKIMIQTPYMVAPFGMSVFTDESTNISKYTMDLSFKDINNDPKVKLFHDCISKLDGIMIQKGVENSKEWFGKKMSKEVVSELYRPLIKESKDPSKYAATIKYKVRTLGENFNVEAFDENKQKFDLDSFAPGSKARCIIELSSIWFVNKQFGCTFTLLQCQVTKPEKVQGFSFQPESDEEFEDDPEDEFEDDE